MADTKNPQLLSEIDGHPYRVADADAWTRSRDHGYRRKVAQTYLRTKGEHPSLSLQQLKAFARPGNKR